MRQEHSTHDCHAVEITTPKKICLNGLWLGPRKPRRAIIWVHGLGSSLFSKLKIAEKLVEKDTAVLMFNNRGHDRISRLAHSGETKIGKTDWAGAAHEVFTDCEDDIQGAVNFARTTGARTIFLVGHSTGCQKSIYWAHKKKGLPVGRQGGGVSGIILLAPVSDWAAEVHLKGARKVKRAAAYARSLVKRGRKRELLPPSVWPEPLDAQRFLSLCTADSAEEIFTYAQPKKIPRVFQSVRKPLLVILAENDEFWDRPVASVANWFRLHLSDVQASIIEVQRASHAFKGKEREISSLILHWIKSL